MKAKRAIFMKKTKLCAKKPLLKIVIKSIKKRLNIPFKNQLGHIAHRNTVKLIQNALRNGGVFFHKITVF